MGVFGMISHRKMAFPLGERAAWVQGETSHKAAYLLGIARKRSLQILQYYITTLDKCLAKNKPSTAIVYQLGNDWLIAGLQHRINDS